MKSFALVLAFIAGASCDAYTLGQVAHGATYGGVPAVHHGAYYGKREAEADAYTLGQVAAGLPVHNAYATGHAHNVGVVTGLSHGVYGAHHAYAVPAAHHGVYYGKREAEADAYTLGQVAAGLPVHNAYTTGHAHNVGVVTHVS